MFFQRSLTLCILNRIVVEELLATLASTRTCISWERWSVESGLFSTLSLASQCKYEFVPVSLY